MSEPPDLEKEKLDALWGVKSTVPYGNIYFSSTVKGAIPELGTIEADVSGKFGRWRPEPFRAERLAQLACKVVEPKQVLDVGGGNLRAADFFSAKGSEVDVCDFESSPYLGMRKNCGQPTFRNFFEGDFNKIPFNTKYDLVWASHVLEHQENVGNFLKKMVELCSDNGYIAIAVPPRKPFIVSGHINLFNPGLLMYRVILSGVDLSHARVFQYDNNICLLAKASRVELPSLNFDMGDLERLGPFFPQNLHVLEGFNGDLLHVGLTDDDLETIWPPSTSSGSDHDLPRNN